MESTAATNGKALIDTPPDSFESRDHWNRIYSTKASNELSWHEDKPQLSLDLIGRHVASHSSIIDIGGGTSMLVPLLLRSGFGRGTVVDLSEAALRLVREGVNPSEEHRITLCPDNILEALDVGCFDVWHDRAVFHFLTEAKDRARYVEVAEQTVRPGGHLVLGTFGLDGPERCSGLPVCRYDSAGIAQIFARSFRVLESVDQLHKTPSGVDQHFLFTVFSRDTVDPEDDRIGF